MKIEDIDLFYLSMPVVHDIGDGSQDALLVRIRAESFTGWGECEASPLVSIANYVCPKSHSACKPVRQSVLGQRLDSPDDITRIANLVAANGLDIPQTAHTFSGIEIALWDLLAKKRNQPVYQLLGYRTAYPKKPYYSCLFGDTPQHTHDKAVAARNKGFRAVKFGWAGYGRSTVQADRDHVAAARQGLGSDGTLLIDAGTVWVDDVAAAKPRLDALIEHRALWLEEPFIGQAVSAYHKLAQLSAPVKLAGGEGAFNFHMAAQLIEVGGIGFIQIDTGRIGGLGPAKAVADLAHARGVTYVNHTFTTHLALSASLQPFAGLQHDEICEYPAEPSALALELAGTPLAPDADGLVHVPQTPGLGVEPNLQAIKKYLVPLEIKVAGQTLYSTPVP
jgi:L-alanine-DL-glutamate epimerase-like enolase superfamily enzyme